MAVRPNEHRAIAVDAVRSVKATIGVADVSFRANRAGDKWRPQAIERHRGSPPGAIFRTREQHEMRADQVDGRNFLITAIEPDVGRPAPRPR